MKHVCLVLFVLATALPAAAQTSILPTLQRIRAEYPTPMSPAQLGQFLNRVAWEHRAEGWGMFEKPGGNNCPAPQGVDISCDILLNQESLHYFDVLSDSEGAAIPTYSDQGPCGLDEHGLCDNFVAPINPGGPARTTDGDFDGDGRTDLAVFRPTDGVWRLHRSGSNTLTQKWWGVAGDIPLAGDFDGDDISDLVIYRPSLGMWFILLSSTDFSQAQQYAWGTVGDIPLITDFDGDGKSDLTVFRPSEGRWYIWFSNGGFTVGNWGAAYWGQPGDQPLGSDLDRDGRTDLVVFRESTGEWFGLLSSSNYASGGSVRWGTVGDRPISGADFDGDGVSDIVVFRPSNGYWYIWYSASGSWPTATRRAIHWGLAGDVPYAGDFDGDGKADVAVWRPSEGYWYVLFSSSNFTVADYYAHGAQGDVLPRLR